MFLFFLLSAAVLTPGTTGSIDTTRRMQVTRSLWTEEPEVLASDDSGVPSKDGKRRAYYGIGQSLVLLPADVVSRLAEEVLPTSVLSRVRGGLAMLLGAVPVAGATGYLAFRLAVLYGLSRRRALAVSVSWFFGTTVLPQAQIWQEAGLLVALMACQLVALEEVVRGPPGRKRYLWAIAGGCSGALGLLTKLPALGFGVVVVALVYSRVPAGRERTRLAAVWLAGLSAGAFLDRLYQFARFGSWWGTYIHEWGAFARAQNPSLPDAFPFTIPMLEGLAGMLFRPAFSIVLVEPMLLLVPLGFLLSWRRKSPANTPLFLGAVDLVMQALFYSRFYNWMGWDGWGNRFLAPSGQIACLGALLLTTTLFSGLPGAISRMFRTACLFVQGAACVFWYQLEVQQVYYLGSAFSQLELRAANLFVLLFRPAELEWIRVPGVSDRMLEVNLLPFLASAGRPGLLLAALVPWILLAVGCGVLGYRLWRDSEREGTQV